MTSELTPWFLGADAAPQREGRYQVRFCVGWRAVFCVWRRGAWWVGGGGLSKPTRVNLRRWPGFHWRGLAEPPNDLLKGEAKTRSKATKRYAKAAGRAAELPHEELGQLRRTAERCITAWTVVRSAVWDPNGLMDEHMAALRKALTPNAELKGRPARGGPAPTHSCAADAEARK